MNDKSPNATYEQGQWGARANNKEAWVKYVIHGRLNLGLFNDVFNYLGYELSPGRMICEEKIGKEEVEGSNRGLFFR